MTEGIWVAIIGGGVTLIAAWWQFGRREKGQSAPSTDKVEERPPTVVRERVVERIAIASQLSEQKESRRAEYSHMQIVETIEATPLFYRSDVEASFAGTVVAWQVKLRDIMRREQTVSIFGTLVDDGT